MLLIVLANIFLAHDVILAIKVTTLFHGRIASNINSIVDETHTLIGCLVLEVIAIHLAISLNELDNMQIRIRNLNRIGLNMSDRIATLLYLMLEIDHEQSTALRHDVVLITRIVERIVEVRGGQTIHRVDRDLQSLREIILREVGCARNQLINKGRKSTAENDSTGVPILMLNRHTSVFQILKPLRIDITKYLFCNCRTGMHGCNIKQCDKPIHTRLCRDTTTFTNIFDITITRFPVFVLVAREYRSTLLVEYGEVIELLLHRKGYVRKLVIDLRNVTHITIIEGVLRMLVRTKYNSGSELIGRIIDGHLGNLCQDLTCGKVALRMIPDRFRCNDVVVAILSNLRPKFFRNRFVPRKTKLLMVNAKLDFPLLQALLLRTVVIDIRVRDIIRFSKHRIRRAVDNPLRERIELLIRISNHTSIENVVIVTTAVESNQLELDEFLDLFWLGVDHADNLLTSTLHLPVHQEEIREYLHIVKHDWLVPVFSRFGGFFRLKSHLIDKLDAIIRLIGAVGRECEDCVSHVRHIIVKSAIVGIFQDFVDEINRRLCCRVILLIEVSADLGSQFLL